MTVPKSTITRSTHFQCDECREWKTKDEGARVRVNFVTFTKPMRNLRSRATGQKCFNCLTLDPTYMSPPYEGNRDTGPHEVEL